MNIGFDLDKVFIDYPPFIPGFIIDKLYKQKSNGELLYRIPSRFEQKIRQFSHYYKFRPPITKNIEHVKKLIQNKNHTYFLISSRFGFLEKQTNKVVALYGLSSLFSKLLFNTHNEQPHLFKDKMIKKLKINIYLDDDLPLLKYLAQKNPATIFYWLNKKTHGKIKSNILAITEFTEINLN